METETEDILGYRVVSGTAAECLGSVVAWIGHGDSCRWLACLNPHSYAEALGNQAFGDALRQAHWLVPDGVGVVLNSRLMRGKITRRITGSDIFLQVHARLNVLGSGRIFLLGTTPPTLAAVRDRIHREFLNLRVVGEYAPPYKNAFDSSDDRLMREAINREKPDVLWVGLSAPKQEIWLARNAHLLDVKFAAGVGAVFDFYSGRVPRSGPAFQRIGLEWFPRLLREPRRLWRRMFISAPIFIWDTLRAYSRSRANR